MASIFRRTHKKPIPDGAVIETKRDKRFAVWSGRNGAKRRAEVALDGKNILVQSRTYYAKWYVDNVEQIENTKLTDRTAAMQFASMRETRAKAEANGTIDVAAERFAIEANRSITDHLDDYADFLRSQKKSPYHIEVTIRHIKEAIAFCHFRRLADMNPDAVTQFIKHLGEEQLEGQRRLHGADHRSPRTLNAYLVSCKAFSRWAYTSRRANSHVLVGLSRLNETSDRRHDRRALTATEFGRLIAAAETGPVVQGVDGLTRAAVYVLAGATGFRRRELASLTLRDFDLTTTPAKVRVCGSYSKNKRSDELPLHPVAMERLRAWMRTQDEIAAGQPLFPLRTSTGKLRQTAKMMQADCKKAGIAYQDDQGRFVDFHALRHTFVSALCRSGAPLATAQRLARHSDPRLTTNIYNHVEMEEKATAIQAVSLPEPLGCTCSCTYELAECAENGAEPGERPPRATPGDNERNSLQNKPLGTTWHQVALVDRAGLEPATPGFSVQCSTN